MAGATITHIITVAGEKQPAIETVPATALLELTGTPILVEGDFID